MRVRDAGRAHGSALMRGLTFELTRPTRCGALPAGAMMNHGASAGKALRRVGSRVERGVRPRRGAMRLGCRTEHLKARPEQGGAA